MTRYQTLTLMRRFQDKPYPNKQEINHLAISLNISEKKIKEWYANRRQQGRKTDLVANCEESFRRVVHVISFNTCSTHLHTTSLSIFHTYTHTRIHTNTHTHTHPQKYTHTHTHTHSHTHTRACTHTHTFTVKIA